MRHIYDATVLIESYIHGVTEEQFYQTPLLQDGVIRQLEIIGEATKRLSKELRQKYSKIPWQDVAGMRDKLIHDYLGVDVQIVWVTAIEDVPELHEQLTMIMGDFGVTL